MTKHLTADGVPQRGAVWKLKTTSDNLLRILRNLPFHLTKGKKRGRAPATRDKPSMEVRYNQETEGIGLKKGKEDKDSHSSLSRSFLKEQQGSVSPSGTVESCEKHRGSAGDPDYCRRILVRGRNAGCSRFDHTDRSRKQNYTRGTRSSILILHRECNKVFIPLAALRSGRAQMSVIERRNTLRNYS